jgi:steroid 5-alpha reductase family enzyme
MSSAVVEKRPWSGFALMAFAYVVAHVVAGVVVHFTEGRHPLFVVATASLGATAALFVFSRAFSNSSFFDAYWSVAPASSVAWLVWGSQLTARQGLIVSLVFIYAIRLTWNWARGWTGLAHEDWRYVDLRNQTGRLYWFVSFFGLHFFPAVMVFVGLVPLYTALVVSPAGFGVLDVIAAAVTLGAIVIETIADEQLRNFRRSHVDGGICNVGLWSWSRHPNYFGEISFWVGLFLFGLAAGAPWWTGIGFVLMIALFAGASIPMAEKRSLSRRPAYAEHQKKVSMLVPMPPRG